MRLPLNMSITAKGGFSHAVLEETQYLINKLRLKVKGEKMRVVEFRGHKLVKAARQRQPAMLHQTNQTDAFHANMALQSIQRHTGGTKEWVHLCPAITDSLHQNRHHLRLECHLCHPAIMRELKCPESTICHPDMCIYILLFPSFTVSIIMHMLRITSTIQIIIHICWLMKDHPLVSTLPAVW